MTDQNQDNQKPKQAGEPSPLPQEGEQVQQPQAQQAPQPETIKPEPVQQPQSTYQQQAPQGQSTYQGQPNYGQQRNYGGIPPQDMPDTYMTISVIATVIGWLACCASSCISGIVGIVAIIFASQVTSKYAMGDLRGAKSSSETAKILAIVSLVITGLSILGSILYAIFYLKLLTEGGFEDILSTYQDALDKAR